jgi:hypothetical protein
MGGGGGAQARLLRGLVGAWGGGRLGAVWSFVDQRNVHGQLRIAALCLGLFSDRSLGFLGYYSPLRIEAKPGVAHVLEDVGENALLHNWALLALPGHDVGAVHNGDFPHQTDAYYFLPQRLGSLILDEEVGDLLIARDNISAGRNADELRRQHQLQCILIALGDGLGPTIFHLLHFAKFWRLRSGFGRLLRWGDDPGQ